MHCVMPDRIRRGTAGNYYLCGGLPTGATFQLCKLVDQQCSPMDGLGGVCRSSTVGQASAPVPAHTGSLQVRMLLHCIVPGPACSVCWILRVLDGRPGRVVLLRVLIAGNPQRYTYLGADPISSSGLLSEPEPLWLGCILLLLSKAGTSDCTSLHLLATPL